jgi:uncharacterized protein (TIGR03437 family)
LRFTDPIWIHHLLPNRQAILRPMTALLLFLATVGSAAGQQGGLFDLTTTGDGGTVYFATTLARKGTGEPTYPFDFPSYTRIYKIDSGGLQLYLERPYPGPVPNTNIGSPPIFSNYYNLSLPQTSRDGMVVAIVGRRRCSGGYICVGQPTFQTTIIGLSDGGLAIGGTSLMGAGRLSGNGRYLLIYADGSIGSIPINMVDLLTGQVSKIDPQFPFAQDPNYLGSGNIIADDGTLVIAAAKSLFFVRGQVVKEVPIGDIIGGAQIDSAARIVAYGQYDFTTDSESIGIYRVAEQRVSSVIPLPDRTCGSFRLSADGLRVMFLCDVPGLPQIYTVNTDGAQLRQVSNYAKGVLSPVMSGDGKVAWYLSEASRLHRINLDTGEDEERLARSPQLGYTGDLTAGSLYVLSGVGFSDEVFTAEYPLPRSLGGVSVTVNAVESPLLSVSPTRILFQVPWETPPVTVPDTKVEVKAESSSPFEQLSFSQYTRTAAGAFLYLSPNYGPLAIHQNFDALVTPDNPAQPGEILHFYATGLGRVASPPADGMPAPADPLAPTIVPVACHAFSISGPDIPVLYAGLAPGFVGIYQLDVRLPTTNLQPSMTLSCMGEGNSYTSRSFAVKP